jgi:hypothetical protein
MLLEKMRTKAPYKVLPLNFVKLMKEEKIKFIEELMTDESKAEFKV